MTTKSIRFSFPTREGVRVFRLVIDDSIQDGYVRMYQGVRVLSDMPYTSCMHIIVTNQKLDKVCINSDYFVKAKDLFFDTLGIKPMEDKYVEINLEPPFVPFAKTY